MRRFFRLGVYSSVVAVCGACTVGGSDSTHNVEELAKPAFVFQSHCPDPPAAASPTVGEFVLKGQLSALGGDNLASNGQFLYATAGSGSAADQLRAIELACFQEIGSLGNISAVLSLKTGSNNEVYVNSVGSGLIKVDVENPAAPLSLSRIHTQQSSLDFIVRGTVLFEASYARGVIAWDIADANAPRELGRLELAYSAEVFAWDMADMNNPKALGSMMIEDSSPHSPYQARSLAVAGNALLVAARDGGLFVIDISRPEAMFVLSRYHPAAVTKDPSTGNVTDASVWDVWGVATDGTVAYLVEGERFEILDISNPAAPKSKAIVPVQGVASKVNINHDYATIALEDAGVVLHDVRTDATADHLTRIATPGTARDAIYVNGDVYVASGDNILKYSRIGNTSP